MLRICLIIAIVAGLAAAAISFTKVKEIIDTTRQARDEWHTKDDQEVAAHGKTKGELKKDAGYFGYDAERFGIHQGRIGGCEFQGGRPDEEQYGFEREVDQDHGRKG